MLPKQLAQINREPRKMNVDPRTPQPDRLGDSMTNWTLRHRDRGKFGWTSGLTKERWNEIFGNAN